MKPARRRYKSGIRCPHCGEVATIRTSEQLTPLVRELRVVCNDIECGHMFVAQFSAIRTVRPSARPNPQVHLPMGDWKAPANDDTPRPANDDHHDKPPAAGGAAPMSG